MAQFRILCYLVAAGFVVTALGFLTVVKVEQITDKQIERLENLVQIYSKGTLQNTRELQQLKSKIEELKTAKLNEKKGTVY